MIGLFQGWLYGEDGPHLTFCREWTVHGERRWNLDVPQPIQVSIPFDHQWTMLGYVRQLEQRQQQYEVRK